mmetsp:Transcript_27934/g.28343  ORF Transcript_27934/g.28343 Transcript_27934/m.28343 type:complete len:116 (-) Transcript_27934:482-829(-)
MRLPPPSEAAFESKILIATNNEEVHDFDNETYNLSDKLDSAAAVDRPKKREALLRKHRESVLNFARSFYQAMQSTKQNILSIDKSLKKPLEKFIIDAEIITDPTWINFCRATIEA